MFAHPIEDRVAGLQEDPEVDQTAMLGNMVAIFRAWERAWQNAVDGRKRRLLMAALVNAFDPESYKEGLAATLFRVVDHLDYGDIRLLRHIHPTRGGLDRDEFGPFAGKQGTMERWHLERLQAQDLVAWDERVYESGNEDPVGDTVTCTEVGTCVLDFVREDLSSQHQ